MSINPKILLNRVKKGKTLLTQEEEQVLLKQINNGPFTLQYAAIYRKERWIEFESALEDYCNHFGLFATDQRCLILYIKNKIKGPWIKIEKHLNLNLRNQYNEIMIDNNFEEYVI